MDAARPPQFHPSPSDEGSPGLLRRVGLRGRLIGSIVDVALTTLTVGIVGVPRMGVLIDCA